MGIKKVLMLLLHPFAPEHLFNLAHFIWADAAYGNKNELTAMSSTKIEIFSESLCFNFWFDVRVR